MQTFTKQGVLPSLVNYFALVVHHIIILQQTLTYAEVVFFHLFLGTFYTLRNHAVLDNLAFFQAHAVHEAGNALAAKKAHEVIFQTHKELAATGVSLATRTTAQLAVYAS